MAWTASECHAENSATCKSSFSLFSKASINIYILKGANPSELLYKHRNLFNSAHILSSWGEKKAWECSKSLEPTAAQQRGRELVIFFYFLKQGMEIPVHFTMLKDGREDINKFLKAYKLQ